MTKLQKLQCDNCGGKIDGSSLRCQSCGMQYKLDEDFTLGRVEIYNGRFVTLEGKIAIPAFYMYELGDDGPRVAQEMTIKKLAEGMAEKILPFMEFRQYYDVHTQVLDGLTGGYNMLFEIKFDIGEDECINTLRVMI